jgi:uncharacterized protein (DUF1778 family)
MSSTLSIRLSKAARETLEAAAAQHGAGVSSYVRDLAEAEALRLRREEIRAQGERFMELVQADPGLAADIESLGTPQAEHPDTGDSWPAR